MAIDIDSDIDGALAIKLAEIPADEFHSLNPSLNKPVILSNASQQMLLPFAHAEIFQENLKQYTKPLSSWTAVQVSRTESVDQAAKTLGVDVDTLREVNGIPKGMRIRAGSTVLIPKTSRRPGDVSTALAENASLNLEKPAPAVPKCPNPAKDAKGTKSTKCATPPASKTAQKPVPKGNSSTKNGASQHKSASTGLANSAKNASSTLTTSTSANKGASKSQ